MGFWDSLKGVAQTAEKNVGGFFGGIRNAVANAPVPGAGVSVGEVAQQIPQAAGQVANAVLPIQEAQQYTKEHPNPGVAGTPGFFGAIVQAGANRALGAPARLFAGAAQTITGTPEASSMFGTTQSLPQQIKTQGVGGTALQTGLDIAGTAGNVGLMPEAEGFFNNVKAAGSKPITQEDVQNVLNRAKSPVANEVGSKQVGLPSFQDGEKVSGEQPVIDSYTAAQGKTQNAPAMANFTPNPEGPDTQYNFGNLKNPFGLLQDLSKKGVAASFDNSGNVVVHDTDNMAKGIINQVVKDNYLEPPQAVKGDVHIMEGSQYDGHVKNIQPNTEGATGAVPNQASEAGGGIQTPNVPEVASNQGGQGQQQVLAGQEVPDNIRNMNKRVNQDNTAQAIERAKTGGAPSLDDPQRFKVAQEYNKWGDKVTPDSEITVYRAGDAPAGEPSYVGTSKAAIEQRYGDRGDIQQMKVRVGDLHDGGGLGNEFVHVPPLPEAINETAKSAIVNMGKNLPEDVKTATAGWINQRESAGLEAKVAAQPFKQFDKNGIEAFKAIQAGDPEGKYAAVRQYFDKKFSQETDAGIGKIAGYTYQHDYLPQLWENSSAEVAKVFGKTIKSNNPGFTFDKVITDYETGIKAGLTPKFSKVSDLIQFREKLSNQAIADKQFFDSMVKRGSMQGGPVGGWDQVKGTEYYAPRPLAEALNNYLGKGSPLLQATSKATGFLKQQVMTQGIPKTAISPHGVTTAARDILATPVSQGGIVGGLFKSIPRMVVTSFAKGKFEQDLPGALDLYRSGLTPTAEEASVGIPEASKNLFGKVTGALRGAFHDPVFQDQLPEAKQRHALDWSQKMQSAGVSKADADAAASKFANTFFGGNNYNALMRSKDFQNSARTLAFAPDMIESLAKTFGMTSKALTTKLADPTYAPYRTIALNATITAGIVMNLANKALSGHWMFQNAGSHKFAIDTGTATEPQVVQSGLKALGLPVTYSSGERYVTPLGQSLAFVSVPADIIGGLAQGSTQPISSAVQSRLSGPVQALTQLATNTNSLGRTISSTDQSAGQNVANAVGALVGGATPPLVQQGYNAAVSALGMTPGGLTSSQLQANYRNANPSSNTPTSTTSTNPLMVSHKGTKSTAGRKVSSGRKGGGGGRRPKGVKSAHRSSGRRVSVKAKKGRTRV